MLVADRVYLQVYGFSKGLDVTTREFSKYWYTVLAVQLVVMAPLAMQRVARLAGSRCQICKAQEKVGGVEPQHELQHLWTHLSLIALALVTTAATGFIGATDAAWHQSTFRDTALTPVHIVGFYGLQPLSMVALVAVVIYGRTRLPRVWGPGRGIPLAYAILGGIFLSTMLFFSLNEIGHSQWVFEERFAQPLHWPIALFLIGGLPAMIAIAMGDVARADELINARGPDTEGARTSLDDH